MWGCAPFFSRGPGGGECQWPVLRSATPRHPKPSKRVSGCSAAHAPMPPFAPGVRPLADSGPLAPPLGSALGPRIPPTPTTQPASTAEYTSTPNHRSTRAHLHTPEIFPARGKVPLHPVFQRVAPLQWLRPSRVALPAPRPAPRAVPSARGCGHPVLIHPAHIATPARHHQVLCNCGRVPRVGGKCRWWSGGQVWATTTRGQPLPLQPVAALRVVLEKRHRLTQVHSYLLCCR